MALLIAKSAYLHSNPSFSKLVTVKIPDQEIEIFQNTRVWNFEVSAGMSKSDVLSDGLNTWKQYREPFAAN